MPLYLSSSIVPHGGCAANSQWYCLRYRRYRYCCWKTRTSYRLGRWLGQPFLLAEVSSEKHPLCPFAFHVRHLVLVYLGVAEVVLVHHQLDRVVAEAAEAAAAEAA